MLRDGNKIMLKSMVLNVNEIQDMPMVKIKKARRELRDIINDGYYPQLPHIRALTLLNTEISIRES